MTEQAPIDIFDLILEPKWLLKERVDGDALAYLLKRTEKDIANTGLSEPKRFFESMRGYLDRATTERTCAYHPGRKTGETPAPLYAPGSCQFVPQAVRNLLIGPHTFALRQRHADHRALLWICKEIGRKVNSLPTRELTYFLNDPDSFVADWREARSSMTEETVLHQLSQAIHWKGDPRTGHEPFKRFNQEAKSIMAVLASVPELRWAKELADEQQARAGGGTIITVLVDAVQSNLTWAAIRAFEENGWPVCTCIHDKVSRESGCNVYRGDGVDPEELVRLANEATEAIAPGCAEWEVTDSPTVVYDKKGEACHQFTVPEGFTAAPDGGERCPCGCNQPINSVEPLERPYDEVKERFERDVAKVHYEFLYERRYQDTVEMLNEGKLVTACKGDWKYDRHKSVIVNKEETWVVKREEFLLTWLYDEGKRKFDAYDTFVNEAECPENVYNLYRGFAVEKLLLSDRAMPGFITEDTYRGVAFIMRHEQRLMGDFVDFWRVFKAHLFQYPHIKFGIMIALLGQKRIGKGQSIDFLSYMVGKESYFMTSNPSRDLWGTNGTTCMLGKMLGRLAEPKHKEYTADPGAMRVWVTDNPVPMKAMREQAKNYRNYLRLLHDGNELVLPDFELDGRLAQCLCSDYWKKTLDAAAYAEYNIELGEYNIRPDVQLLYYYQLLSLFVKKRYTFHDIPTSAFSKQQKKNNRKWIEKFIVYVVFSLPWGKKTATYREAAPEDQGRDGTEVSLESLYRTFCENEHIDPERVKVRSATTQLGEWVVLQGPSFKGLYKYRPWDSTNQRPGATQWTFNLDDLRTLFSLEEEKEQFERDLRAIEHSSAEPTLGPLAACLEAARNPPPEPSTPQTEDEALLKQILADLKARFPLEHVNDWMLRSKGLERVEAQEESKEGCCRDDEADRKRGHEEDSTAEEQHSNHSNKRPKTAEMTEEERVAWKRGYRTAAEDAVLLDEYNQDKDDGYVSASIYYLLYTNPEQYGDYASYWFSDGAPNMGAFRQELRKIKPADCPEPSIPEHWDGFKRYGF